MTLENLVEVGSLKPHKSTRAECLRLLESARRSLKDAVITEISAGSRFDAAYKAITQSSLLALMLCGYRPATSVPGHHATLVQTLPKTLGISKEKMVLLDQLRRKRNLHDYAGISVSEEEAGACERAARELFCIVEERLAQLDARKGA